MPELIVLTCASGKQCTHLIPHLYSRSEYRLRLVVHSQSSRDRLQTKYPNAEVVQADLRIPTDCAKIVNNAHTIYYVSPPFEPHEAQFAFNVIDAAEAEATTSGKLPHFILSSVLHPYLSKLLNHDCKRHMEEYLAESTLPYTVLQAGHFTENSIGALLAQKDAENPVFVLTQPPEIKFSFSCIRDHAEVSVKVIYERSTHFYATYELTSTAPMTYTQYVEDVGKVLGKTFEIKHMTFEEAVNFYVSHTYGPQKSVSQRLRESPERLALYYLTRGVNANPNVLQWILGRPGTSPAQLAQILLKES